MEFPGKGKKRPLIDIRLSKIHLDAENPRLAKQRESVTQFDLVKTLYDEFDLEELAMSMCENGYFDEEPIIVVPTVIPKGIAFDETLDTDALQKQLQVLLKDGKLEFTVVEGNRRIATAKILSEPTLRQKLNIRENTFPKPKNDEIADDLKEIPAIVYFDRKLVAPYLGVRHIAGLLKWDAYAKATYIAQNIEDSVKSGVNINESINRIQQQVSDRSDVIKKQYLCYRVMKVAEDDLSFDTKNIKDKFSLITVALNSTSIRTYIGCPTYRNVDFSERIIPLNKLESLRNVLTWVYGDGKREPILTDSRRITKELAPVLASKEATEYLIKNNNLEEAFERSEGERDYIIRKINSASIAIKFSLGYAWKYKSDDEIQASINECAETILELQKMINQND